MEFSKVVTKFRRAEFRYFFKKLQNLRGTCLNTRSYFSKLAFATRLKNRLGLVSSLEYNEETLIDKEFLNKILSEKYALIFNEPNPSCNTYNTSPDKLVFDIQEVEKVISGIAVGKAFSWDLFSDELFSLINKQKDVNIKNNLISAITNLLNSFLDSENIPNLLCKSRIFVLNKLKDRLPNLNSLRPININSIWIKLLEKLILNRLELEVHGKSNFLNKNQVGFMKSVGTDVNLNRLVEFVKKVKGKR